MSMLDHILEFIRSWFYPLSEDTTRKRRAQNSSPETSKKYRKVLSPMSLNTNENSYRVRSPPNQKTIILDDDDDDPNHHSSRLIDIKSRNNSFDIRRKSTSFSPIFRNNHSISNDLSFSKISKSSSEKKRDAEKRNFSYITSFTKTREPITRRINNIVNDSNNSDKITPIQKPKFKQQLFPNSSSLDYSMYLDDKRKYKELLNVATRSNSFNDSNISDRTKRLVSKALKPTKPIEIIDLTDNNNKSTPKKLNTKDTLVKLLNNFDNNENEPHVIEDVDDSDSDVEILPEPPSPKPDIRVEPINSFKTVAVDTSKTAHKQWLDLYSEEYGRSVEDKTKMIQMYTDNASQLSEINHDLLVKKLTKKINDSLTIKSTILPVIEIEEEQELPELTENQIREVKKALHHRDPHYTLITKFNLPITVSDIRTLSGLNWLNDNVINYYMNVINQRSDENPKYPRSYCFNTFFYPKLVNTGPSSLRRWTKKIDLFSYELICIPVHLSVHWCMAIVNLKERTIKYYDSMGSDNNTCLKALKDYLEYEHMDKKNQAYDTGDFHLENVKNIPQQMNGCDCGVFACTFAEFATRRARFTFEQKTMPYLRQKMILEILNVGVISNRLLELSTGSARFSTSIVQHLELEV